MRSRTKDTNLSFSPVERNIYKKRETRGIPGGGKLRGGGSFPCIYKPLLGACRGSIDLCICDGVWCPINVPLALSERVLGRCSLT